MLGANDENTSDRSAFRRRFGDRCAAFGVIHVDGSLTGLHRELDVVSSAELDGAFLIDHRPDSDFTALLRLADAARGSYPEMFLGANFLDLPADEALAVAGAHGAVDAVWTDDAGVGDGTGPLQEARAIAAISARHDLLHFGGVAFKYQRTVPDVGVAARAAVALVDVITTSGPATGQAPDLAKVESMRAAAPDSPLAIASGITPRNASRYAGVVDAVLVATGISTDGERLDLERSRSLARAVAANATDG